MLMIALFLLAQSNDPSPAQVMEAHRQRWSANPACRRARDESEIVVCSRREADKYRVPLTTTYNGPDTDQGRLNRLFDGADGRAPAARARSWCAAALRA